MLRTVNKWIRSPVVLFNQNQYFRTEILRQPKMRLRTFEQIVPPPGRDLQIPQWEPEFFLLKIGGGTSEYADKFENIHQIFNASSRDMKFKGIPAKERKHILRCVEKLRRGLLSFEYLFRRTVTKLVDAKED